MIIESIAFSIWFHSGMEYKLMEVKKHDIYFYASRKSLCNDAGKTIHYEAVEVNLGFLILPMNIDSGTFTAPKNGLYLFNFIGYHNRVEKNNCETTVQLLCNDIVKGTAKAASTNDASPILINRILGLKLNDRISVRLEQGCLKESNSEMFTHFIGVLLNA